MPNYLTEGYTYCLYLTESNIPLINELSALSTIYNYVPEESISLFNNYGTNIEDRDAFDYVYKTRHLADLANEDPKVARRLAKFENMYPKIALRHLDLTNTATIDKMLLLTESWCNYKGFDDEALDSEIKAVVTYATHSSFITDESYGIYDDDKLIAFTLNEIHSKDWCIGHFGKSDYSYKYLSLISEIYTARIMSKRGVVFLNHQQDTGIVSLREFKESLRPFSFLRKYTLTLNTVLAISKD
jgi:hypothetical protein